MGRTFMTGRSAGISIEQVHIFTRYTDDQMMNENGQTREIICTFLITLEDDNDTSLIRDDNDEKEIDNNDDDVNDNDDVGGDDDDDDDMNDNDDYPLLLII